jgi:hypothetical protein
MKNIQRNKTKLQSFLESLIYIWQLCFDCLPEPEPYVCPMTGIVESLKQDRIALKRAVAGFELKKLGGGR